MKSRKMGFGSFDGIEDYEYNDAGVMETSEIFPMQDSFCLWNNIIWKAYAIVCLLICIVFNVKTVYYNPLYIFCDELVSLVKLLRWEVRFQVFCIRAVFQVQHKYWIRNFLIK